MTSFKRINNITGWVIFIIAASVYLFTMEPTVSLWDSGEFISAAAKLEVGHPPGAPFYLMLARIFSLFAASKSSIAICINSLSAIASAFTILLLFWTITHLARRILLKGGKEYAHFGTYLVIGSGVIGALAFCFTDSFWVSATEAEVYALSSLFTALVFWSILKWEEDTSSNSNRWLVLIAYLMGISIGVHLLNLLAIPAIVLVYYFRRFKATGKNTSIAILVSFVLLFVVLYVIIPGTVKAASLFEIVSVNSFGLPVNSGLAFFVTFIVLFFISLAWLTYKKGLVLFNTVVLCVTVMLIGYCSYAMIVIRANANTPLNTGNPSNVFSLLAYLNRDQYGDCPLFYGQVYNAPVHSSKTDNILYAVENGKYNAVHVSKGVSYDQRFMTVFPRMYSSNSNHVKVYKDWGTISGKPVEVVKNEGSKEIIMKPTFADNLEFFVKYQVGYMYLRYFMWNFAGKQNDLQGNGGIMRGNWISGIDFLDRWFIGPQNHLPDYLKNNPGRNRYFLLPLLLGIAGMVFQYARTKSYFGVITLLFLLTGLAIVLYTNQTPLQPRERDYVYVGSFYAFSIWIGLGFFALFDWLKKLLSSKNALVLSAILSLLIPAVLFAENIDDHNRNGRYVVRDIAYNYLKSCEPGAILFTSGDNDTYPLWYLQEVEGFRTDVRVVNLMLLNTPWYIDQQKVSCYQSPALPISFPAEKYQTGKNNIVYLRDLFTSSININDAFEAVLNEQYKIETSPGSRITYLPARKMFLPVSDSTHKGESIFNVNDSTNSVSFTLPGSYIGKSELIVLDILSHFNWKRPVYFNAPGYRGTLGLDNYLQLEGFTYKLSPLASSKIDSWYGSINTIRLYNLLMNQAEWDVMRNGKQLLDDHVRNMLSIMRVRQNYARLSLALSQEGQWEKAVEVLDRVMKIMPPGKVPYDSYCLYIAEGYYKAGATSKADEVVRGYAEQLRQELNFFNHLSPWMKSWVSTERSNSLYYLDRLKEMLKIYKRDTVILSF